MRLPPPLPVLLLLAAACQPVPHPFAQDVPPPRSPVLSPRDSGGIVVAAAPGTPAAVAEAVAAALRDAEIPATTLGSGNRASFHLLTRARAAAGQASLDWELRSAAGKLLGQGNAAAESADARDAAGRVVPAVAQLVQDEPVAAAPAVEPLLAVRPVTGAPGDGGRALTRAMDYALRNMHVALAEKAEDKESLVLIGKVELSAPREGKQQVKVHWTLERPDGREIGQVNQENAVPAGSLDGPWGDVAFAVASAAAPGVAALIQRVKAAGNGAS
jgi:hypothetical protein